jgi:Acetyltransferase (GNAT) domain
MAGVSVMMDARLVPIGEITPVVEERWRRLAAIAIEPNLSFEPEAVLGCAAYLPGWRDLQLLVVEDGERYRAAMVLRPLERRRDLPLRSVTTRVDPATVPMLPVLGTPLVDPERAPEAVTALLAGLASDRLGWPGGSRPSVLLLDRWHDGGPVASLLGAACRTLSLRCTTGEHWERPLLSRQPTPDGVGWPKWLGARRLAEIRRRARRLTEAVDGAVRCVDRAEDTGAVDEYLRLERSGWKGRAGTALADAPERAWAFKETCRRWRCEGRLSMLTLEAAGTAVALRCAVRSGDVLFLLRIAYDEEFARYGPGVQLELATGEHFLGSTDARSMDSCCTPGNTFYDDWLPHRTAVATAAIALRPGGAAWLATVPVVRPAVRRLRPSALRAAVTARRTDRSATPPVATTIEATDRRSG